MESSKTAIVVSKIISVIQLLAGISLVAVFGLCTIMYLTDPVFQIDVGVGFIIFCLICDLIGIVLIVFASRRRKIMNEFRKYNSVISVDPTGSIANLALAVGSSRDVVKKNLELMIKRNYFTNVYINQKTDCLVIRNAKSTVRGGALVNEQPIMNMGSHVASEMKYVSCTCKNCGGINKVVEGSVGECEFCGSPISL